jgi:protein SCO1
MIRMTNGARTGRWALTTILAVAALAPPAPAQQSTPNNPIRSEQFAGTSPGERVMKNVAFEQKLDGQVPADLTFRAEDGRTVRLADYLGKKPVILNLVYYTCPMLCTQVLNGTVHWLIESKFTAGDEFDIVTVSIDPRETPELATKKKAEYLARYNRPGAEKGWHFLTGDEPQIQALADAVGYRYVWDDATQQFAHPSGIVVLTPAGRISHYFYGIQYPQQDVRLALVEASENKIGSPVDRLLLLCYHYDPQSGRYGVVIMNAIRAGGIVTLVAVIGFMLVMLRRERRQRAEADAPQVPV